MEEAAPVYQHGRCFFFLRLSHGSRVRYRRKAVSYTHLDVYKRQTEKQVMGIYEGNQHACGQTHPFVS